MKKFLLLVALAATPLAAQTVGVPTVAKGADTATSLRALVTAPAVYDSIRSSGTVCSQKRVKGVTYAKVCRSKTGPWEAHVVVPDTAPTPVPPPSPPPDTTTPPPPAMSLTLVVEGTPSTGAWAVRADPVGFTPARVNFSVDGVATVSEGIPAYCSFGGNGPCDLKTIALGDHIVHAVAVDAAGAVLASASTTVTQGGATPPPPPPPDTTTPPPLPPPPTSTTVPAELPRVLIGTAYHAPTGRQVTVAAGASLQAAINAALCGDELLLTPGAIYSGELSLAPKACASNPIHIRTAGPLPPEGVRMTPAGAASFAKIISPNGDAPIRTSFGARGYRLIALEVYSTAVENIGLVYLGGDGREQWDGQVASVPGYITLDRMYIHGLPHQKSRRCVAVNGVYLAVIDSYLSACQSQDTDAQAVWGAAGPGPYKIVNNYLEGTGENVMFGGSDSPSEAMLPQDIEIRGNLFSKPEEWRLSSEWLIKNLFELKVGKRVLVEGNVFQNSWSAGHTGFAMGFASMNQSGGAPWSQVADVTFRLNYVRHSGSGINLAATGMPNSTPAVRYTLTDNVFEDIGRTDLMSDGRMVQVLGPVSDVLITHNTFLHTPSGNKNSAIYLAYGADPRATIVNNIFTPGQYGIVGDAIGQGTTALAYYLPGGVFLGNVFAGFADWPHPTGNYYLTDVAAVGFDAQLRLLAGSPVKGKATDGTDPGARIDALIAATARAVP